MQIGGGGNTFVVDDFLGKLDRRVVPVGGARGDTVGGFRSDTLSLPVRAAGGRVELLTPDDAYASRSSCQRGHLTVRDRSIQLFQESGCEIMFLFVEDSLAFNGLFVFFGRALDRAFTGRAGRGDVAFDFLVQGEEAPWFGGLPRGILVVPVVDDFLTPECIEAGSVWRRRYTWF